MAAGPTRRRLRGRRRGWLRGWLRDGVAERGDDVGLARPPRAAPYDAPGAVQDQDRGGAQDAKTPHQVEPALRVDLDVPDAVHHAGDLVQNAAGRPARRAERAGELHEGRPFA